MARAPHPHSRAVSQPGSSSPLASHWPLDPEIDFLNHGSFGSCPKPVLAEQQRLRTLLEAQPVEFFARRLEPRLDRVREVLGALVGAEPEDLAFVPNATSGVNAVLRSLEFAPGDELLVTNQEYNACRNVVDFVAERSGAQVVVVDLPFPLDSPGEVVAAVLARVTPRTRFALLDHVTSQTGLILPVHRLATALAERGVELMVDGAHAPGMIDLDLASLGAAYFTGNCHKWLCTPKGSAVLWVRRDLQPRVRPAMISHGANSPRRDRSRFLLEFDWTGTIDPTAVLAIPAAIQFLSTLFEGGWAALRDHNRNLVLNGRAALCSALGSDPPCPPEMIGSLASVPLPDGAPPAGDGVYEDPLQLELLHRHSIEVPVMAWPRPPQRLLRISAQAYNSADQYQRLADALPPLLAENPD